MDSIPNLYNNAHILPFPYIGRALHVLDANGGLHVWGKVAFEPFPSHIKNTGTDDNPHNSPGTLCVEISRQSV